MDAKLITAMFRLMDLLETAEVDMKRTDINLSLEMILSINQARKAVWMLEAAAGIDVKKFLSDRTKEVVANKNKSGLQ